MKIIFPIEGITAYYYTVYFIIRTKKNGYLQITYVPTLLSMILQSVSIYIVN